MKNNSSSQRFSVSQKIYAHLLRAYPQRHREEYGAAMAQLFRDQCRDAWNESRSWGMAKLWLRVLPDLVNTSIMERLAALNERKSMSDKLANLSSFQNSPTKIFFKVFATVFLIVLIASVAITFILPESYASTARIKVEQDAVFVGGVQQYDPVFLQKTFEVIPSSAVLDPVISRLDLNVQWGKKYFAGQTLKNMETAQMLKGRLQLVPIRGTKLIAITVYSDDAKEAAVIANAIAESYRDYRMKSYTVENIQKNQPMPVQITDKAEPGRAPVRPNKTLNIVLGAFIGILSASVLGAVAAFVVIQIKKRKQLPNATA